MFGQLPRSLASPLLFVALAALPAPGCARHEEGLLPVGGEQASLAGQERFVRRLYLDLSGAPPAADALAAAVRGLNDEGNTPKVRMALADQILGTPGFAGLFVTELEAHLFQGETPMIAYNRLCAVYRLYDATCKACAPAPGVDYCEGCSCQVISRLRVERESLSAARGDLAGGAATSEIERRFARADVYRTLFGSGPALVSSLFQNFLGRTPDPDEVRNGAALVQGSFLGPKSPAGLLFHRYGTSYADLVDIVFASEAYREAIATRLFQRYLGRRPSSKELGHFAALLDDKKPDARPVIRALVASHEYLAQ